MTAPAPTPANAVIEAAITEEYVNRAFMQNVAGGDTAWSIEDGRVDVLPGNRIEFTAKVGSPAGIMLVKGAVNMTVKDERLAIRITDIRLGQLPLRGLLKPFLASIETSVNAEANKQLSARLEQAKVRLVGMTTDETHLRFFLPAGLRAPSESEEESVLEIIAVLQAQCAGGGADAHALTRSTVNLGRTADNDIILDDPQVSGRHARITFQGAAATLMDLGSLNGTRLKGQSIPPRAPLPLGPGDVFQIGPFSFCLQPADERALRRSPRRCASVRIPRPAWPPSWKANSTSSPSTRSSSPWAVGPRTTSTSPRTTSRASTPRSCSATASGSSPTPAGATA